MNFVEIKTYYTPRMGFLLEADIKRMNNESLREFVARRRIARLDIKQSTIYDGNGRILSA